MWRRLIKISFKTQEINCSLSRDTELSYVLVLHLYFVISLESFSEGLDNVLAGREGESESQRVVAGEDSPVKVWDKGDSQ